MSEEGLQKIIEQAVGRLMSKIAGKMNNIKFSELVEETQQAMLKLGARIVEEIVLMVDESFNAQRNKKEITLRHTKERKLLSSLGEICVRRNLYYDKGRRRYFFAVDEIMSIDKFSRVDKGLKVKLINDATLTSFGKASKLSGNVVSRQSVHNFVQHVPNSNFAIPLAPVRNVDELFIEADEDHVHLNTGKIVEVKLVYVHEGRRSVGGRVELINPRYFVSVAEGVKIWDKVSSFIYSQYEMKNTKVHISGDGASWIKYALNVIPGAIYHMDKFHVYKALTESFAGNKSLMRAVKENIKAGNVENVRDMYISRWNAARNNSERRLLAYNLAYIENNFSKINLSKDYSCSAESHVSHVLSARLSSRPMGWSVHGVAKMANLRAYYFNDGNFDKLLEPPASIPKKKKYSFYANHNTVGGGTIATGSICYEAVTLETAKKLRDLLKR